MQLIPLIVLIVSIVASQITARYVKSNAAIRALQQYLRIDTTVNTDYFEPALNFWRYQAEETGLKYRVFYPAGLPIVVLTWMGYDTLLPSIAFNTHMDVVPVSAKDGFKYDPFAAIVDSNGDIYAAGAQDTKTSSIQYLEAIRRLRKNGYIPRRTIHMTLMPDEEIGGPRGMEAFKDTEDFKELNISFFIDEGVNSPYDTYYASFVDKRPWQLRITVEGASGHGFNGEGESAMEKFYPVFDDLMEYRAQQNKIAATRPETDYGAYTSVNINQIHGGVFVNVVPAQLHVEVDIRLAVDVDTAKFKAMLDSWILRDGVTYELIRQVNTSAATEINNNPYWNAIQEAAGELGISIVPVVCPATSDMVPIRSMGIPAIGLNTLRHTELRMHAIDEYTNVDVFLEGISVFQKIMQKLSDLE